MNSEQLDELHTHVRDLVQALMKQQAELQAQQDEVSHLSLGLSQRHEEVVGKARMHAGRSCNALSKW